MADFSFSDNQELLRLSALVADDPESFEHWDNIVRAAEAQEGGLNRNSSPNAISATRETYDQFLARFPLFYAFWKRYADLEFTIAGTEAAELVYERGIASTGFSVDLWTNYCTFKEETSHDPEVIRDLFERGAQSVGLDFLAHPFWDKYLEFEGRNDEANVRVFQLLQRICQIPLHQYSRYHERYRALADRRPVTDLIDQETLAQIQAAAQQQHSGAATKNQQVLMQEVRRRVDTFSYEKFSLIQQEVNKRWPYEQNIKRPYYHVTELEEDELDNWRKYLDFEEREKNYIRTKLLYERCLIAAANYEEFWFRYVRWMTAQGDKKEEIRNIYQRASCVFVKIAQPAIRIAWARYEEAQGRADVAADIHEAILLLMPSEFETQRSLIHLTRRKDGAAAAEQLVGRLILDPNVSVETRGALVAEWAKIKWQHESDFAAANALFTTYQEHLSVSHAFWSGWLQFEIDRPTPQGQESEQHQRVRNVHVTIHTNTELPEDALKALASQYLSYLEARGSSDAMKELVQLDAYIHGPPSIRLAETFESLFGDSQANGPRARLSIAEHAG